MHPGAPTLRWRALIGGRTPVEEPRAAVPQPLVIAVSPYHLTTREPPAVAALLLADSVVTLLPSPASGRTREDVRRAVSRSPRYLRMMESWRWTIPLWHEGVLDSAHEDSELADDLRGWYDRIGDREDYAELRPLTRHAAAATPDQFLDLLAADILKGGPDPGLNIPVSAAIDDFAVRHGILVARAAAASIAQLAEARVGRRAFALALPVLTRASARLRLRFRDELGHELDSLRAARTSATAAAACAHPVDRAILDGLGHAAHVYTNAFAERRERLQGRDDDEGIRVTTGYVSVAGLVLPPDVAIRSGLAAARALNTRTGTRPPAPRPDAAAAASAGAPRAAVRAAPAEPLVALVVKQLSAEPDVRPL